MDDREILKAAQAIVRADLDDYAVAAAAGNTAEMTEIMSRFKSKTWWDETLSNSNIGDGFNRGYFGAQWDNHHLVENQILSALGLQPGNHVPVIPLPKFPEGNPGFDLYHSSKIDQGGLAARITRIVQQNAGDNRQMLIEFRNLYAQDPVLAGYNLWPATRDWLRAQMLAAGKDWTLVRD